MRHRGLALAGVAFELLFLVAQNDSLGVAAGVSADVRAERFERGVGHVEIEQELEVDVFDVSVDGVEFKLKRLTARPDRSSPCFIRQVQTVCTVGSVQVVLPLRAFVEEARDLRRIASI
eukprot:CAMPEP_0197131070 /NCGR_PEP_ID=MMETSP1390-20130617/20939_1 /TAXON_ID=38833 /ORGANISM="Micromonas sp., Strain CCMP2099" /LENGTH=118 /DNA_ID=CAMNT_0042573605 /DNA_START=218 /DNA_END=574 /DNA_ORIENTATION=+